MPGLACRDGHREGVCSQPWVGTVEAGRPAHRRCVLGLCVTSTVGPGEEEGVTRGS